MKKQSGFTLIELVVVMVILGILAAVALPKFVDMSTQARVAKMAGAVGAVKSAVALTHAKWLAQGSTGTVALEGVTTPLTMVNGYPAAGDIASAAGLDSSYTVSAVVSGAVTISENSTTTTCRFTYTEAAAAGAPTIGAIPTAANC
jgi:MSHA pilin protein MshA